MIKTSSSVRKNQKDADNELLETINSISKEVETLLKEKGFYTKELKEALVSNIMNASMERCVEEFQEDIAEYRKDPYIPKASDEIFGRHE